MKEMAGSRTSYLLPVLMLPLAAASLWLLVRPTAVSPRVMIVAGSVVIGWYLWGGWLMARRLVQGLDLARQVRRARPRLAEAGMAWLVDPGGTVRAQSAMADRRRDLSGRGIDQLLVSSCADPAAAVQRLQRRAAASGAARLPLQGNACLTVAPVPGSILQIWQLDATLPAPPPSADPGPGKLDLHAMPLALLDMDGTGRVRAGNPAAEALLGPIAPGAAMGDLLDGLGRPLADWITEVREGRSKGRSEVMRTRAEGTDRDLQVTLAAAPESDRLFAVLTDASALKTLEAQFVQSQKMQAIGQLAGGIAHDFNNLLTAITGHCDLLMVSRDKTDRDYDDLQQISHNANRAAALVRQLLAFSRKQTMNPALIDLRDALPDLTHLLNRLVGEQIRLTVSNAPDLRPIRADLRQLEQVLMNLVVNARDAMPAGGEIAIRTENLRLGADRTVEGANLPRGDYVRISVTDQGCGMSPELLGKIFEPFFTTKKVGEGTGLGLSTAYGIVKQSGGYIFCDSSPDEGTTFTLYFPAQKPGKPQAAPAPAAAAPVDLPGIGASRPAVLLVEDEAPVRAFARRALALRGFDVFEAASGEDALALLQDEKLKVDIFVSDVIMPGLDGPGWVREALLSRPGTPVIFMSGYTDTPPGEGSAPIPNARFLAKPFSLSELVTSVESHLTQHGSPERDIDAQNAASATA